MEIDVDLDQLSATARELHNRAAALIDVLDDLDQAARTVSLQWSGMAQQAFWSAYSVSRTNIGKRIEGLGSVATTPERLIDGYEAIDRQGAEALTH